jgi:hypothetical protein
MSALNSMDALSDMNARTTVEERRFSAALDEHNVSGLQPALSL